jgi:hypothetical protein
MERKGRRVSQVAGIASVTGSEARPDCAALGLPHQDSEEKPDFCTECDAVYLRWVGWVARPAPTGRHKAFKAA